MNVSSLEKTQDGPEPRVYWIGAAILYLSLAPFFFRVTAGVHHDVELYYEVASGLFSGVVPYRDRPFEYPPYAILWFLGPALGGSLENFQMLFAFEILLFDMMLKWVLLLEGMRRFAGWKALVPVGLYSVGAGFLNFFYLQRMDLIPAVLSIWTLLLFNRKRFMASGLVLALAIGTKLYPVLFGLPLLVLASRQGKAARPFLLGCVLGLLPIAASSAIAPWWRFLEFHAGRGLEVESVWAAGLWLGHYFTGIDAHWTWVKAWEEVTGGAAAALLHWARPVWLGMVMIGTGVSGCRAWGRGIEPAALPEQARLLLLPLLPFVAFNIVLSPQYMIWLLSLAGLAVLGQGKSLAWVVLIATVLTTVWYPSRQFGSGLSLVQTAILLGRNGLLIAAWGIAIRESFRREGSVCE